MLTYNSALELLHQNINRISENGIYQRTDAWLKAKRFRVGGSNVASVIGLNRYKSREQLLEERIANVNKFSDAMSWGNLFEQLSRKYIESKYCCQILGDNIYYEGEGIYKSLCYSPDGICVISSGGTYSVTLIEIKCPYTRIPSGYIPDYYYPQIQTGLQLLTFCEYCLYSESVFRRCTWKQLSVRSNICCDTRFSGRGTPLSIGFIVFYSREEHYSNEKIQGTTLIDETDILDIGAVSDDIFSSLLYDYDKGLVSTKYSRLYTIDISLDIIVNDLKQTLTETEKIIGVLPWKLVANCEYRVKKESNYLDKHLEIIDKFVSDLRASWTSEI